MREYKNGRMATFSKVTFGIVTPQLLVKYLKALIVDEVINIKLNTIGILFDLK